MGVLVNDLRATIAAGGAVVVVGTGISAAASGGSAIATWRGLLEDGIERCAQVAVVPDGWAGVQRAQLDLNDVESWIGVAEQVTQRLGGREGGEFGRWLRETVGELELAAGSKGLIEALGGLGVPICTTNYDSLIEAGSGLSPVSWRAGSKAQRVIRGQEAGVLHLHGYWDDSESVVLGVRSYEAVLNDGSAQAVLQALATMRSMVFVGFGAGLSDPNFGALRRWMADTWGSSEYRHFRLVRESEREAVADEHSDEERIVAVVYGEDHSDLVPFLRTLAPRAGRPASRATSKPPTAVAASLPAPRACFGRDELIEQLAALVADPDPLPVAVLGPPGIGKSALTLAAAHDQRVSDRFGRRRYWVRCDGSLDASSLVTDIARALGLPLGGDLDSALINHLASEPALLILDNAETPWLADIGETEEFLARLAALPGLALVCSIRGSERPLGPRWADSIAVPPLRSTPAEQVFLAAAGSKFTGDPDLGDLLVELDGMPLAIELLGRLAQPEADLSQLRSRWEQQRTELLSAGPDPDRHLSVAVSFELSIGSPRLSDSARRLLALLALLPDGVDAADLEPVFQDGPDASADLRRAGLAYDDGGRLRVLKPIRDHVAANHPLQPQDADRASRHFAEIALRHGPRLAKGDGAEGLPTLSSNAANLAWAVTTVLDGPDPIYGIKAAVALTDFSRFTGASFAHVLAHAEEKARDVGEQMWEGRVVFGLGVIAAARSDHDEARTRFQQALGLYRQKGHVVGEASCIRNLGHIAFRTSDHKGARERFEEALPLFREAGNVLGEANCIASLGEVALTRSEHEAARECFERALPLYREVKSLLGEANCIAHLGIVAQARHDHDAARARFEEALPLFRRVGSGVGEANCIRRLGAIALAEHDYDDARALFEEALPLYFKVGDRLGEANCIAGLAHVALDQADDDDACARYEAALLLYRGVSDMVGEANCILGLGNVAFFRADRDGAHARYEEALGLYREVGDVVGEANCLGGLGRVALAIGNPDDARRHLTDAISIFRRIDDDRRAQELEGLLGELD